MAELKRVVVVGGGAAGFFAAIACAEKLGSSGNVSLYEATAHPLAKVRVSGGGRCNVTHACFDPRELVKNYPRGGRELLGAFHRFQPRDMVEWLATRGVETKTEEDGRMFPTTDDSATIVGCLTRAAENAGVKVVTSLGVRKAEAIGRRETGDDADPGFWLTLTDGSNVRCERLLLATGGNRSSAGLTIAASLGHHIEPPVPSLFTFHIDDKRLEGLSGVSVQHAIASVPEKKLRTEGPLLITHWGMSGPAILKLSAWGARELAAVNYEFPLVINFVGAHTKDSLTRELDRVRKENLRKQIATWSPVEMPQRLWERLVTTAGIDAARPWAQVSNAALVKLATQLTGAEFNVVGKSLFKEEFVTCGGVRLSEVDFKTMESRCCAGLHFAGEVLDIDGVTGGFNFQSAWTTGWLAGQGHGSVMERVTCMLEVFRMERRQRDGSSQNKFHDRPRSAAAVGEAFLNVEGFSGRPLDRHTFQNVISALFYFQPRLVAEHHVGTALKLLGPANHGCFGSAPVAKLTGQIKDALLTGLLPAAAVTLERLLCRRTSDMFPVQHAVMRGRFPSSHRGEPGFA